MTRLGIVSQNRSLEVLEVSALCRDVILYLKKTLNKIIKTGRHNHSITVEINNIEDPPV